MEDFNNFTTAIVAAVTGFITVYRMNSSGVRKRLREYYCKVLIPFMSEYTITNGEERNWCKFISNIVTYEDAFVPPYIHYLIKKNDMLSLEKVLVNDAYEYYENEKNNFNFYFSMTFNMIFKVLSVGCVVTAASAIFLMMLEFFNLLLSIFNIGIIEFINQVEWKQIGLNVLVCLVIVFIAIVMNKAIFQFFIEDVYSCKLSEIEKIITNKKKKIIKKIKKYNKSMKLGNELDANNC